MARLCTRARGPHLKGGGGTSCCALAGVIVAVWVVELAVVVEVVAEVVVELAVVVVVVAEVVVELAVVAVLAGIGER